MTTSAKHGNFTEAEMHISNEAYRRYLLEDENAAFDENGEFSRTNMVKAQLAMMYEEDGGPEKVQAIVEECEQRTKK